MAKAGPNLKYGALMVVAVFVFATVALYGLARIIDDGPAAAADEEAAAEGDGAGGVPGGPVTLRLIGKDLKFDKRTLAASPGAEVTVILDNQDAGVLHNVAFYTNNRAAQRIFVGDLFAGPAVREERFTAPATAGNYFFRCDAHPDSMSGTFSVR
jgi:plastocyanin